MKIEDIRRRANEELTHCSSCNCMTKSIRKSRAKYICGKCSHDKSLGDFYQGELTQNKGE